MSRKIRRVYDEQPGQKMWNTYLYMESEPVAKQLLCEKYHQLTFSNAHRLAFQNTTAFIYYLKQAREYYRAARNADLMVKPLLLYYGMASLTKAYVLTRNPHYPDRTSQLKHGMTTRKRKKENYRFVEDDVKIQKEGLLPHILSLLNLKNGMEEKYKIQELLGQLPQLYDPFTQVLTQPSLSPVYVTEKPVDNTTLVHIKKSVLDYFHISEDSFVRMLNRQHTKEGDPGQFTILQGPNENLHFTLAWRHPEIPHVAMSGEGFQNTMLLADSAGHFFLRLTNEPRLQLPDFVVHLLLLFHLGMLARYEPERWGEIVLTFGSDERYLIHELLQLNERVYPNLLLNELLDEQFIFLHP